MIAICQQRRRASQPEGCRSSEGYKLKVGVGVEKNS